LVAALLAGYLLMEVAARITLVSGRPLGYSLRRFIGGWANYALFGGILLGCAAYEAGNLLGGYAGLALFMGLPRTLIIIPVLAAAAVLYLGSNQKIGRLLGLIVLTMGVAFLCVGVSVLLAGPAAGQQPKSGLQTATVLSVFGTTIVPYNFMLAAGLSPGQSLKAMRGGLGLSFLVGGLITFGILLTGTVLDEFSDFSQLALALDRQIGGFGRWLLGIGLFAAGFSSAITAPLAAAMAGRTLFEATTDVPAENSWSASGKWFRMTWVGVLALGLAVAVLELDIVSIILAAQVVNAFLLPFLAALVIYLGSRTALLGNNTNSWWQNLGGMLVFAYLTFKSSQALLGNWLAEPGLTVVGVTLLLVGLLGWKVFRNSGV
jgi:Mn2+/Fe2+ NRAMP family transporter